MLSNLKTLDINYNVSDYMGVPFVEHIMNSENEHLLNLVSDFTFDWIPEFDHAYERITTPEFKEKVKYVKAFSISAPVNPTVVAAI